MTPLSPLDALGPAFRRTREVLATPFRLGFFLKIALIAALTQPSFYSASISYPLQGFQAGLGTRAGRHSAFLQSGHASHFATSPGLAVFGVAALVIGTLIAIALWVLFSYLYCRLRFTLFDLVIYKRGRVRQAWSAYGRQSWRYFGLVILVSLAFLTLAALLLGPQLLNLVRILKPLVVSAGGRNIDPLSMLGALLPFILSAFALGLLWAVTDALIQDFLLPPVAIEDAPLESTFGRFFTLLKSNFGSMVLYILLRFALGIGITGVLLAVFFLVFLAAALATFGIGLILYHTLWASMAGQVVCVALAILVGLVAIALYLMAIISIYGFAAVFKQSYAAYFFGGRYPALGDRLEPPFLTLVEDSDAPEQPSSPPPSFPPLEEAPPVW